MNTNTDNIVRSLEEDILQDHIDNDTPLLIAGVDSFDDLNVANARISSFNSRIQALLALLYYKESTILDVKKDDAAKGSIFFNKETNSIEYFDGQSWKSNIFGPNNILDHKTFSISDLNGGVSAPSVSISKLKLSTPMRKDRILFIVIDGDLLDTKQFYTDPKNEDYVFFVTPMTVYNSATYYVLGSQENVTGSIPRYEVVDYIGDGVRSVFPISNNDDFIATYRSSIQIYVDGLSVMESTYKLNEMRNKITLNTPPKLGSKVEIKTLYGVTTDFRGSVSYVEQIEKAKSANQKVFKYNGVSDAIKVYLDGKRLVLNEHFKFDYVQKLVILNDDVANSVEVGSLLIVEKEMSPMSKEPMYGLLTTQISEVQNGQVVLKNTCNGVSSVILMDDVNGTNAKTLLQKDYYVNDQVLNFIDAGTAAGKTAQVSYLTHSTTVVQDIPTINDFVDTSATEVWSINKVKEGLDQKLDAIGNANQNIELRDITAHGNVVIDGSTNIKDKLKASNGLESTQLNISKPDGTKKIATNDASNSIDIGVGLNCQTDVNIRGNLTVYGTYTGSVLEVIENASNTIMLNSKLGSTGNAVPDSSILVRRGKNGTAKLLFEEADQKWKLEVTGVGAKAKTAISLDGHTHNVSALTEGSFEDITLDKSPRYNSQTNYNKTKSSDFENATIEAALKMLCSATNTTKSVGRSLIDKSSIVDGEDPNADVISGSIFRYDIHEAKHNAGAQTYQKKEVFAILEDGTPAFGSTSGLALPTGTTNQRLESVAGWKSTYNGFDGNNYRNRNGIIRYNTDEKCVEMKVDGTWLQFVKPDVTPLNNSIKITQQKFVKVFNDADWRQLRVAEIAGVVQELGFVQDQWILEIQHNLNNAFVRIEIFDDKRTPFPILYSCIDENKAYVYLPTNLAALSGSKNLIDQINFLKQPLHGSNNSEGPGHNGLISSAQNHDITKKFVAFVYPL